MKHFIAEKNPEVIFKNLYVVEFLSFYDITFESRIFFWKRYGLPAASEPSAGAACGRRAAPAGDGVKAGPEPTLPSALCGSAAP